MKQNLKNMKRLSLFLIFFGAMMMIGCATAPMPAASLDGGTVQLARVQGDRNLLWWESPGFDWRRYRKLMIDPVTIRMEAEKGRCDIDPEDLDAFIEGVLEDFARRLAPEYPVVAVPGDDVLRIRAVVTGIDRARPAVNLATTLVAFVLMDMGGASIEVEFFDSVTGERLAAMADRKTGSPLQLKAGFSRYGHARAAFKQWADELKTALTKNS